jgi:glycerol-3-phosphate dehydrogenase
LFRIFSKRGLHAVIEEAALSLNDFMLRRSLLGLLPSLHLEYVEKVTEEMGSLLGWGKTERQEQIQKYRETAALGCGNDS